MCKVQYLGIELIFDLLLHTFVLIQRICTHNFPNNVKIVPSVKDVVAFDFKCDLLLKSLFRIFY